MTNFSKVWRKYFIFAGLFSLFINILYLTLPVYVLVIYDRVLFSSSKPTLVTLSVGAVFVLIILGLFEFFRSRLLLQSGVELNEKVADPVLEEMHIDASRLNKTGYTQGLKDLQTLRNYLSGRYVSALFDVPWIPVYLIVLFFMHPWLAYISLAGVFVLIALTYLQNYLVGRRLKIADVASFQGQNFLNNSLSKIELIYSLGMLPGVLNKLKDISSGPTRLEVESDCFSGALWSLVRFIRISLQIAIYGTGAYLFFSNALTGGMLIASVLIVRQALSPVEETIGAWKETVLAKSAYKRLQNFLQSKKDKETMQLPAPQGRVDMEGAALALEGRYILRNISVSLQSGEHLGLIGPSASGKTAFCRVLLGYWPSVAGKIRLDGADILQWNREELGGYIGYLPQETDLFPGTINENIARLGPVDPDKVVQAAQKAEAHQLILHLPQGYDTVIDSSGKNLSAGQRQRIALARALYNDPVLVVLDEPEFGLDDEGERALLNCLTNLKKSGTTVIIATHKPRLISSVDKILLLKEGQASMLGPRQEVLNKLMGQQKQAQSGSN